MYNDSDNLPCPLIYKKTHHNYHAVCHVGSAAERFVSDVSVFDAIVNISKTIPHFEWHTGGNAALMANRFAAVRAQGMWELLSGVTWGAGRLVRVWACVCIRVDIVGNEDKLTSFFVVVCRRDVLTFCLVAPLGQFFLPFYTLLFSLHAIFKLQTGYQPN